jgi:elongation factor P
MKIKAGDLKKGHIIDYNNKKLEVAEVSHITPGRRAAIVQLCLYDIIKNTKHEIRCSPDDDLQQIAIYNIIHIYMYDNGEGFVFLNKVTYDQVIVPYEELNEQKRKFLVPEQEVQLGLDNVGNFVTIIWPQKVIAIVESTPPTQKNASSDDKKKAILTNGISIIVPGYVKEGEEIIINLTNLEFVGKHKNAQ